MLLRYHILRYIERIFDAKQSTEPFFLLCKLISTMQISIHFSHTPCKHDLYNKSMISATTTDNLQFNTLIIYNFLHKEIELYTLNY